jgi:hypothetical protein
MRARFIVMTVIGATVVGTAAACASTAPPRPAPKWLAWTTVPSVYRARPAEGSPAVFQLQNLSPGVLDVTPTIAPGFCQPDPSAVSAIPPPSASVQVMQSSDTVAEEVARQVLRSTGPDGQQPACYLPPQQWARATRLLPAGETITVTSRHLDNAYIARDLHATAAVYEAQVLTKYVIDDWLENHPEDFAALIDSTGQCINSAAATWQQLSADQTPDQIAVTANQAFWGMGPDCQDMRDKIIAKRTELLGEAVDLPKMAGGTTGDVTNMLQANEDNLLGEIEDIAKAALKDPQDWVHG